MTTNRVNKIALVTGASRGGGRGVAVELGAAGYTVYVTGRSTRGAVTSGLPGTAIEDTADLVNAAGGTGIPVRCDHLNENEIASLIDQIRRDHGRIDLLVNNAWAGYEGYDDTFTAPFWKQPMDRFERMIKTGLFATILTTRHALPLMMPQYRGLIVNTTADVGAFSEPYDESFPLSVFYDTAKTAINRMAYGMADNLKPYGITVVALSPGWMRTEAVLAHLNTDEEHWREVPDLRPTESPRYLGRAVVALAGDDQVMDKTGQLLRVGALAKEYGFTDIDGRYVPVFSKQSVEAALEAA
jgi:NAD(P)-dependent dehydrogenase (short-subunit alcohol dehydrogenase family)